MKQYEFSSLYFIGVNVNYNNTFDWSKKNSEEIICYNLEISLTDGRAASLLISYFHYFNWLIDADILFQEASKIKNQSETNFLCGILLKVNSEKYKRTINLYERQKPAYLSRICRIKIEKAGVVPDPEFKKVGFRTQGYEYEQESKFKTLDEVVKINSVIANRTKGLKAHRTELKNIYANSLESGAVNNNLSTNDCLKHSRRCK